MEEILENPDPTDDFIMLATLLYTRDNVLRLVAAGFSTDPGDAAQQLIESLGQDEVAAVRTEMDRLREQARGQGEEWYRAGAKWPPPIAPWSS